MQAVVEGDEATCCALLHEAGNELLSLSLEKREREGGRGGRGFLVMGEEEGEGTEGGGGERVSTAVSTTPPPPPLPLSLSHGRLRKGWILSRTLSRGVTNLISQINEPTNR